MIANLAYTRNATGPLQTLVASGPCGSNRNSVSTPSDKLNFLDRHLGGISDQDAASRIEGNHSTVAVSTLLLPWNMISTVGYQLVGNGNYIESLEATREVATIPRAPGDAELLAPNLIPIIRLLSDLTLPPFDRHNWNSGPKEGFEQQTPNFSGTNEIEKGDLQLLVKHIPGSNERLKVNILWFYIQLFERTNQAISFLKW